LIEALFQKNADKVLVMKQKKKIETLPRNYQVLYKLVKKFIPVDIIIPEFISGWDKKRKM